MIKQDRPILIYDDLCFSCTKYAKMVNSLVNDSIPIIGHYSVQGKDLKKNIFPNGYEGLEMSWFVTETHAYGGRAGLIRLIKYILFSKKTRSDILNHFDTSKCATDCKTIKGVFLRSCSIISCSKKITIHLGL